MSGLVENGEVKINAINVHMFYFGKGNFKLSSQQRDPPFGRIGLERSSRRGNVGCSNPSRDRPIRKNW